MPSFEPDDVAVKLSRTKTWGGLETDNHYSPTEPDAAYAEHLGEPGQFPFTRGSYPRMYRSRMWTQRTIVGYGGPEDTREGVDAAIAAGNAGFDVVSDVPDRAGF